MLCYNYMNLDVKRGEKVEVYYILSETLFEFLEKMRNNSVPQAYLSLTSTLYRSMANTAALERSEQISRNNETESVKVEEICYAEDPHDVQPPLTGGTHVLESNRSQGYFEGDDQEVGERPPLLQSQKANLDHEHNRPRRRRICLILGLLHKVIVLALVSVLFWMVSTIPHRIGEVQQESTKEFGNVTVLLAKLHGKVEGVQQESTREIGNVTGLLAKLHGKIEGVQQESTRELGNITVLLGKLHGKINEVQQESTRELGNATVLLAKLHGKINEQSKRIGEVKMELQNETNKETNALDTKISSLSDTVNASTSHLQTEIDREAKNTADVRGSLQSEIGVNYNTLYRKIGSVSHTVNASMLHLLTKVNSEAKKTGDIKNSLQDKINKNNDTIYKKISSLSDTVAASMSHLQTQIAGAMNKTADVKEILQSEIDGNSDEILGFHLKYVGQGDTNYDDQKTGVGTYSLEDCLSWCRFERRSLGTTWNGCIYWTSLRHCYLNKNARDFNANRSFRYYEFK